MNTNGNSVMFTDPKKIEIARWLAVRAALKLELHGYRRSGSRASARTLVNQIVGTNCRTREIAYDLLNAKIVAELGQAFDRSRTP